MSDKAKRAAQEALFSAITDQAEASMKAALQATEKARLLRELAEAYRLTAGGAVRKDPAAQGEQAAGSPPQGDTSESSGSGQSQKKGAAARKRGSGSRSTRKAKSPT